jgi:hypothetical protein
MPGSAKPGVVLNHAARDRVVCALFALVAPSPLTPESSKQHELDQRLQRAQLRDGELHFILL